MESKQMNCDAQIEKDRLRNDPRYTKLVRRMGLSQE
jgi:hypothetical protein